MQLAEGNPKYIRKYNNDRMIASYLVERNPKRISLRISIARLVKLTKVNYEKSNNAKCSSDACAGDTLHNHQEQCQCHF